ncbi:MAG: hypothetical protein P4L35_08240 [Ignavibacteriaceae bacterium]|nr:hypothetical protein [Ignavibacteriaceae bacterium]
MHKLNRSFLVRSHTLFDLEIPTDSSYLFNGVCENVMNDRTQSDVEILYKFRDES